MPNRTPRRPYGFLWLTQLLLIAGANWALAQGEPQTPPNLAAEQAGSKTSEAAPSRSAEENALLGRLDDIYAEAGSYALAGAELHRDLGQHYLQRKLYPQAIDSFRHSLHLQRINLGLYSPSQLPVAGQLAQALVADNKMEAAFKVQRYRHWLGQRHYRALGPEQSRDYLALLKQLGDWQLANFFNDQFKLDAHVFAAVEHYRELLNHPEAEAAGSDDLQQALQGFLAASYYSMAIREEELIRQSLQQQQPGFTMSFDPAQRIGQMRMDIYRQGREAVALVGQKLADAQRAQIQLALADWHLVFKKLESARQLYRQLQQQGGEQLAQQLQRAEVIPALPKDLDQVYKRREQHRIALQYSLNRLGQTRNIRRAPGSDNSSAKHFRRARNQLLNQRHRPRLDAGGKFISVQNLEKTFSFP